MKLKIFSIYDSKAKAFITPFFSPTTEVGQRSFGGACNDPTTQFHRHPGDFSLFEIGEFGIETGEVTPHKQLINHGLAIIYQDENKTLTPTLDQESK